MVGVLTLWLAFHTLVTARRTHRVGHLVSLPIRQHRERSTRVPRMPTRRVVPTRRPTPLRPATSTPTKLWIGQQRTSERTSPLSVGTSSCFADNVYLI